MDAFFARNRLSAYLDGSLSEGEAAEVEAALARDPALHADFEAMKRAVSLLREVGPRTAPPDLHGRIMARVAREPQPVGRLAWLRRPLSRLPVEGFALAAAALLVVVAIQWKPDQQVQPPPPPVKDPVAQVEPQQPPATPPTTVAPPALTPAEKPAPRNVDLGTVVPVTPRQTSTTVSAPETPYQAPWEQQAQTPNEATTSTTEPGLESTLSAGVSMRTPLYYRLTTRDPAVLQALAGIAGDAGGQLKQGGGGSAATTLTTEHDYATVSLVVPPGSLGEVTTAIKGLGAIANPPPAKGPLFAADQVVVVLDVQYMP